MNNTQESSSKSLPVAFGLAGTLLRGKRLQAVGEASRQLRVAKQGGNADAAVAAAADAHAAAKEAYAASLRLNDDQAREALEAMGVTLCRR